VHPTLFKLFKSNKNEQVMLFSRSSDKKWETKVSNTWQPMRVYLLTYSQIMMCSLMDVTTLITRINENVNNEDPQNDHSILNMWLWSKLIIELKNWQ
jgi:hypothetical protein